MKPSENLFVTRWLNSIINSIMLYYLKKLLRKCTLFMKSPRIYLSKKDLLDPPGGGGGVLSFFVDT